MPAHAQCVTVNGEPASSPTTGDTMQHHNAIHGLTYAIPTGILLWAGIIAVAGVFL